MVGLGHELLLRDETVIVTVEAAEIGCLALRLPVGWRGIAAGCGRAGKQFLLAELSVAVGVELLEAGFLARVPFVTVDSAVVIGVEAQELHSYL